MLMLAETALRASVASVVQAYVCPDCGMSLRRWDRQEREVVEATFAPRGCLQEDGKAAEDPILFDWRGQLGREMLLMSVDGLASRLPERGDEGLLWYEGRSALMRPVRVKSRALPFYLSGVHPCEVLLDHLAAAYRQGPTQDRWVLSIAGIACFGEGSPMVKDWRGRARSMLLAAECGRQVLRELTRLHRQDDGLVDREAVLTEFRYFRASPHHMRYQRLMAAGLPIGSGAMESAAK